MSMTVMSSWFQSELAVKTTAFVGVLLVSVLADFPTWRASPHRFEPMWAALVLLSPIFPSSLVAAMMRASACVVGAGVGGYFSTRVNSATNGFCMLFSWRPSADFLG